MSGERPRLIGRLGPVRKRAQLTYVGTCPACLVAGGMTVQITPYGDRPSCRTCIVVDVVAALKTLDPITAKEAAA